MLLLLSSLLFSSLRFSRCASLPSLLGLMPLAAPSSCPDVHASDRLFSLLPSCPVRASIQSSESSSENPSPDHQAKSDDFPPHKPLFTSARRTRDRQHLHHQQLKQRRPPPDSLAMAPTARPLELLFENICVKTPAAAGSSSMCTSFLRLSGKRETGSEGERKSILKGISGYARPGQILGIMGPSGSGKTTLLSSLSGRVKPDYGLISVNGEALNKPLRRKICYVLQQDVFFADLTVRQTLNVSRMHECEGREVTDGRGSSPVGQKGGQRLCESEQGTGRRTLRSPLTLAPSSSARLLTSTSRAHRLSPSLARITDSHSHPHSRCREPRLLACLLLQLSAPTLLSLSPDNATTAESLQPAILRFSSTRVAAGIPMRHKTDDNFPEAETL